MEYCIRYVDFPLATRGITVRDESGFYNVYINSRLSREEQEKALRHELFHIERGDFDREDLSISEIENIR